LTPVVLALWLFALAASVAHACGLDEALAQPGGGGEWTSIGHQAPDDGVVPGCGQFCADDIPLVKTLKAVEDSPAGTALLLPAFASTAPVAAHARTIGTRSGSGPPPVLQINTLFVRLAL
jgi:hypothetical protein